MNANTTTKSAPDSALTPEQVHEIVQDLRSVDYAKVGEKYFHERMTRLEAAGWKLGIQSFRTDVTKGRKGFPLKTPRHEWRNIAYFYHDATMIRVFYWNNSASSRRYADDLALRQPAPAKTYKYRTYNKSTTAPAGTEPTVGTHVGQRVVNRAACEKCGTPTNWVVDVSGRLAYWCGCGN